jgi:hypothetical protein
MTYGNIPKKRSVVVDEQGRMFTNTKLGLSTKYSTMYPASGTINSGGDVIVTGTHFKVDSVIVATYNESSSPGATITVVSSTGYATFVGTASKDFYYVVFNLTNG